MFNLGFWIAYGLGFLCGLLVGNPTFRKKFFTSLRRFLAGLSEGAKNLNDSYKRLKGKLDSIRF